MHGELGGQTPLRSGEDHSKENQVMNRSKDQKKSYFTFIASNRVFGLQSPPMTDVY